MARPVMLSNGQMMVGINHHGLVHDFYYPYVGLDNLTNARSVHHKFGVWINDQFSWVDDGNWEVTVNFESDALISQIVLRSSKFKVELRFSDFIDHEHNAFVRRIDVKNLSHQDSDIRLFMHQVFQISRAGRADTVLFVPDANYILDYKGRCALLIYGQTDDGQPFDQYATGNYAIEGKEGTFKDAEDGQLSNNPVEHGSVDSVIRFKIALRANEIKHIDYWIIAAASQYECEIIHNDILKDGALKREQLTRDYWQQWLNISQSAVANIEQPYQEVTKKSLMVIKAHCDRRGGILASGDSSIFNYGRDYYCYCWPRDGAFAMWPLIRLGYREEPKLFFEFCRDTLNPGGYLMHKYQPDRAIGSTWHPLIHNNRKELAIQEDETAIVVAMLGEYLDYSHDNDFVESIYPTFIKPAADFMASFIDDQTDLPHASYDIWESKFLTTSYTSILVAYALDRAAKFAERFDFPDDAVAWRSAALRIQKAINQLYDQTSLSYRKGFYLQADGSIQYDDTIDASSLYAALMFNNGSKNVIAGLAPTVGAVEKKLMNPGSIGGVIRFSDDDYMRQNVAKLPNPWFVCGFWLAQYYIETKQTDKAKALLDWSLQFKSSSDIFSEQVDAMSGQSVSVGPLVWSHAEFINTVLDLVS